MQLVETTILARLFEIFQDSVECVFLNACYSAEQAEAISQHIPYVIGMKQDLGNRKDDATCKDQEAEWQHRRLRAIQLLQSPDAS